MNKLVIVLAVVLTVNTFAATAMKAAKKAPVAKPAAKQEQKAPVAAETTAAPVAPAPAAAEAPQVNPQPAPQPAATMATATTSADAGKITGNIATYASHFVDSFRTENSVDLGYKWGNNHVIYEQDFNTNLYNPSASAEKGLNLEMREGFFRFKKANIWESESKTYSLSYELRPYLPTRTSTRERGQITSVRNYAKFAAKASDSVTLSLWEIPIVHIFNRAGTTTDGVSKANPGFENRVYLIADWNMTDKLSLSFPLMLNSSRMRAYNELAAVWDHYVWINPELGYAFTDNYSAGLAWYNDESFMKGDLSGFTLSEGFKAGVAQVFFRASL